MDQNKSTVLCFGMPDAGQKFFAKALENYFCPGGGASHSPFTFVLVPSDRSSRVSWVETANECPRVVATFFFVDLRSLGSILLSVRVYNWLRAQITDESRVPRLVAFCPTAKEATEFTVVKENIPPGVEAATFSDKEQLNIQQYIDFIAGRASKKTRQPGLMGSAPPPGL